MRTPLHQILLENYMFKLFNLLSFRSAQGQIGAVLFLLVSFNAALPARSDNNPSNNLDLGTGRGDRILRASIEYPSWQELPASILRSIENYEGEHLCAVLEQQKIFIYSARFQVQVSEYIIANVTEVKPDGSLCLTGFPVPISGQWSNDQQELSQLVDATVYCRFNPLFTSEHHLFANCQRVMSDELVTIE